MLRRASSHCARFMSGAAEASRPLARLAIAATISRSRKSSSAWRWRWLGFHLPLRFQKQLGLWRMRSPDLREPSRQAAYSWPACRVLAVVLRERRGHLLAVFQTHARHWHQKLHRHMCGDLAVAHLLLDGFRKQLDQRQPARHPTHAAIEAARQLIKTVAEALLQFRQQPALFQRRFVLRRSAANDPAPAPRPRSSARPRLPPCPGPVARSAAMRL